MNRRWAAWLLLSGSVAVAAIAAPEDAAPPASASAAPAPREARIPFAKKNIWNWRVIDDKTVLIQDQGNRWYKATLLGNCLNLAFAQKVGFDAGPTDTFDRFSSIITGGRRCQLTSLVSTTAPPKKSKPSKATPAAPGP